MSKDPVLISAKDCLPFDYKLEDSGAFEVLLKQSEQFEKFHFSDTQLDDDLPELAYFNPSYGWVAGRMVGEAKFRYRETDYKIRVKPRFGEVQLFRMLSEIYNVRFIDKSSKYESGSDEHVLIKKLISFLWLNLLAKGNRYGLPRRSLLQKHYGDNIRGRFKVSKSFVTMRTEGKVHSEYREKSLDENIAKLLKMSQQVLESNYFLREINQPKNATYAIQKLNSYTSSELRVTEQEYREIQFKEIYKTYKPVIDLSWDIIQNENIHSKDQGKISPVSYFIDMAEIWELYIKSLLKKELTSEGWSLISNEYETYRGPVLNRKLIPDIVFRKGKQVIVFDAKYKLMEARKIDIDRSDFFQIHTYMLYLQQKYEVLAGGLIYPFSKPFDPEMENITRSKTLFARGVTNTVYCIDGIDLSFLENEEVYNNVEMHFETAERNFLKRIHRLLENQSLKKIA